MKNSILLKRTVLIVVLFVSFLARGQNQEKADSLKNELVSIEDDSTQFELLRLITVYETDPNIQIEFCLLLIEKAEKNNDAFYLQKRLYLIRYGIS